MPSLPQQAALGLDVKNEPAVGFREVLIAGPTDGQDERLADSVMAVNVAGAYVRKKQPFVWYKAVPTRSTSAGR